MIKIKAIEFVLRTVTTLVGAVRSFVKLIGDIGKLKPKAKSTA